ncbi:MAG: HD domain-containing protein [Planctomycetota bacterium]|nr:HD domain-containing protein [Planctomycetota bacterium]
MKHIPSSLIPALLSVAACLWFGVWVHEQLLLANVTNVEMSLRGVSGIGMLAFLVTFGMQATLLSLILSRQHSRLSKDRAHADHVSNIQAQELVRTRNAIIFGMAKLADSRDRETGNHLERIGHYSTRLAKSLRRHPDFRDLITDSFIHQLGMAASLHDIGKVGISDTILMKPDKLSASERARMQLHTIIGGECIAGIEQRLTGTKFLKLAREVAMFHHEKWDGSGYPSGLSGNDIPLAARIVALADVYDALSVERVYKPAMPHAVCVGIIKADTGAHFDPRIVDAFLKIEDKFETIANQFADPEGRHADEFEVVAGSRTDARSLTMTPEDEQLLISILERPGEFRSGMSPVDADRTQLVEA